MGLKTFNSAQLSRVNGNPSLKFVISQLNFKFMRTEVLDAKGDTITVTVLESAGLHPTVVSTGSQTLKLNPWTGRFE